MVVCASSMATCRFWLRCSTRKKRATVLRSRGVPQRAWVRSKDWSQEGTPCRMFPRNLQRFARQHVRLEAKRVSAKPHQFPKNEHWETQRSPAQGLLRADRCSWQHCSIRKILRQIDRGADQEIGQFQSSQAIKRHVISQLTSLYAK